jgi:hypothetical protein
MSDMMASGKVALRQYLSYVALPLQQQKPQHIREILNPPASTPTTSQQQQQQQQEHHCQKTSSK